VEIAIPAPPVADHLQARLTLTFRRLGSTAPRSWALGCGVAELGQGADRNAAGRTTAAERERCRPACGASSSRRSSRRRQLDEQWFPELFQRAENGYLRLRYPEAAGGMGATRHVLPDGRGSPASFAGRLCFDAVPDGHRFHLSLRH
jgi:hypothetical protein